MINTRRIARDVVTIGASAGGLEALFELLAFLPSDLPAAIVFVIHRSPVFESRLPWLLARRTRLRVVEPADGHPLERGFLYAAPRDQHLVMDNGCLRVTHGPKEHRTRPAIDPLFRSAAKAHGPRVLGILLSGQGDDGVSGLVEIKAHGGLSIVQDPREARHPTMPKMAIREDDVDGVLVLRDIAAAITALAAGNAFMRESPPEAHAAS